jgi:hypothetical protein
MAYLLDANVFIQAKNLHYGMDFCPAFWDWLDTSHRSGAVLSVEKVGDELKAVDDDLRTWAEDRGNGFFLPPDALTITALARVAAWVNVQHYVPAAINEFLQVADYYLVSFALAHKHTVVTHEVASAGYKRVKIPSVCIGVSVKCMTPYEMLRAGGARFLTAP